MIITHEGLPGTGKTYDAIIKIISNLKKGRVVCTNIEGTDIPIHQEAIKFLSDLDDYQFSKQFIFIPHEKVREFWTVCPEGSLIIIDEIQKYFNSKDWQNPCNRAFADWGSTHRHHGYDLIMITQNIERVDGQVRGLTEWTYRYKKINFLGSLVKKSYVVFAFSGDDKKEYLSKTIRQYDKKYFPAYKSYVTKDVKEQGIQKHVNLLKHPIFFAIPFVLIMTIYFALNSSLVKGGGMMGMVGITPEMQTNLKNLQSGKIGKSGNESKKPESKGVTASVRIEGEAGPALTQARRSESRKVIAIINGKKIYAGEGE